MLRFLCLVFVGVLVLGQTQQIPSQGYPSQQYQQPSQGLGSQTFGSSAQANSFSTASVYKWTSDLYTALQSYNVQGVRAFFDDKSSLIAFGQEFTGEQLVMFVFMAIKTVNIESLHYQILAADDTKAASIVRLDMSGTYEKTGVRFQNESFMHVINWGPGVVNQLITVDSNLTQTASQAMPRAEKDLWAFLWALFATQGELSESSPAITTMVSPNYQLILHVFPAQLFPETTYHGRAGFIQAWEDAAKLSLIPTDKLKMLALDVTVVASNDTELYIESKIGGIVIIKHQIWRNDMIELDEVWLVNPVAPWDVLPLPTVTPSAASANVSQPMPSMTQPTQPQQPIVSPPASNLTQPTQPTQPAASGLTQPAVTGASHP